MAKNQNNRPTVLLTLLLPKNKRALNEYISIYRYGDLGSDGGSYYTSYSFYCGDHEFYYYMSYDYNSRPGYGDPNIFYFMYSFAQTNNNYYSRSYSGDDMYEYLDYVKGLTILALSPSDNYLGNNNIGNFLCNLINYFKPYSNDLWDYKNGYLIARKYADQEPIVAVISKKKEKYLCFATKFTPIIGMTLEEIKGCTGYQNLDDLICKGNPNCDVYFVPVSNELFTFVVIIKNNTEVKPYGILKNKNLNTNINYKRLSKINSFLIDLGKDGNFEYFAYYIDSFNRYAEKIIQLTRDSYLINKESYFYNVTNDYLSETLKYKNFVLIPINERFTYYYDFNNKNFNVFPERYYIDFDGDSYLDSIVKLPSEWIAINRKKEILKVKILYYKIDPYLIIENLAVDLKTKKSYKVLKTEFEFPIRFLDINGDLKLSKDDLWINKNRLCKITRFDKIEEESKIIIEDDCGNTLEIFIKEYIEGLIEVNSIVVINKKPKTIEFYADDRLVESSDLTKIIEE